MRLTPPSRNGNPNTPIGTLYGKYHKSNPADQRSTDERRRLSTANRRLSQWRAGALGRTSPTVIDSVENNKVASWFNGRRSVTMAIQRQPGTNTVAVVDAIQALLPQFREQLPASVSLDVLNDRSIRFANR